MIKRCPDPLFNDYKYNQGSEKEMSGPCIQRWQSGCRSLLSTAATQTAHCTDLLNTINSNHWHLKLFFGSKANMINLSLSKMHTINKYMRLTAKSNLNFVVTTTCLLAV